MSHLTFAHALTQAEAQARTTLPVELHKRLSAAVALVTDGRVFQTTDGSWQVDSTSREGLVYSVNGHCSCDDYHCNKPPQGLCKHRLAMFLSQRALTLMPPPPAPVVAGSATTGAETVPVEAASVVGLPVTTVTTPVTIDTPPASVETAP